MSVRGLFDNSLTGAGGLLFEAPAGIVRADEPGEVAQAIAALEHAVAGGAHAAGFFAYELGYALEPRLEPLMPSKRPLPLLWFALFDAPPQPLRGAEIETILAGAGTYRIGAPQADLDRDAYKARFERVKSYIAAGDIYQLNLTLKARFNFEGDRAALYRVLRKSQPVRTGALIETPEWSVLSLSPELFLETDADRNALSRPMKGTARRGMTLADDAEVSRWLANDAKSRAENLMIVDLTRNDLGRIAETGSVRVDDLFTVEPYRTLHQMSSGVSAKLQPATGLDALLRALFPPGSVTGAPKLRAVEIIRELENEPRGVYTGAIGWLAPNGESRFNVAIRTLVIDASGRGEIGIGSGVVHDSEADAEYDECLLKLRFLIEHPPDFALLETLRLDPGGEYYLLERHLERLQRSAAYFGYRLDLPTVRQALEREAHGLRGRAHRVRLLLAADGTASLSAAAMDTAPAATALRYVLSPTPVDSGNVFAYHKTTVREFYDREQARAAREQGADEVVFVNERGELTEGSRTNIFVARGGRLLTPPVSSGLLAGTLRAELLRLGKAEECVLAPRDLERADAVYLGNSVRGLLPAMPPDAAARRTANRSRG